MTFEYVIDEDKKGSFFYADSEEKLFTFVIEYMKCFTRDQITSDHIYRDLSEVNLDEYNVGSHFMIESPDLRNWKLYKVTESRSWTWQKIRDIELVKELQASTAFNVNTMGRITLNPETKRIERTQFFPKE
jgi:hypothetical protein